jgi:hypothetical protein
LFTIPRASANIATSLSSSLEPDESTAVLWVVAAAVVICDKDVALGTDALLAPELPSTAAEEEFFVAYV